MIPFDAQLPINLLAAGFNHTSATYKFYWFLSLLDEIEEGHYHIPKHKLFVGMVAASWYTINYFHISFGPQDQLHQAVEAIAALEQLTVDEDRMKIKKRLLSSANLQTLKTLRHFDHQVPHRFLSPWFPAIKENKKAVYGASAQFENQCLYAVDQDTVTVNPAWINYLSRNAGILRSFCYWKLSLYLQKHNPNVPDIPNKLIKLARRNGLTRQRKFWNVVIAELGGVDCIYTNTKLQHNAFAVEHFIPYAFVSHDLLWNLIPANPAFNSAKSDKLPILSRHFDRFYEMQKQAIEVMKTKMPKDRLMEDYLSIFPDFDAIDEVPVDYKEKFRNAIEPLITIASNNGFEFMRD
ncbi:HNH endonuclease domain-containing protein [Pedobacter sp. AW1-32]|uniref:HNH endonuclease domain-containing protein n=1 Tax=Pedobacter sp. AW1-32 TaxID=3383026 RepID=UPI003FF13AEB